MLILFCCIPFCSIKNLNLKFVGWLSQTMSRFQTCLSRPPKLSLSVSAMFKNSFWYEHQYTWQKESAIFLWKYIFLQKKWKESYWNFLKKITSNINLGSHHFEKNQSLQFQIPTTQIAMSGEGWLHFESFLHPSLS